MSCYFVEVRACIRFVDGSHEQDMSAELHGDSFTSILQRRKLHLAFGRRGASIVFYLIGTLSSYI